MYRDLFVTSRKMLLLEFSTSCLVFFYLFDTSSSFLLIDLEVMEFSMWKAVKSCPHSSRHIALNFVALD